MGRDTLLVASSLVGGAGHAVRSDAVAIERRCFALLDSICSVFTDHDNPISEEPLLLLVMKTPVTPRQKNN
jgi:hypothetical protein